MEKINPVEHGQKMYAIMIKDGVPHDYALFRAICCACEEQRGRCAEACEETAAKCLEKFKQRPDIDAYQEMAVGANKAAEEIRQHMPPVNLDKDGILR